LVIKIQSFFRRCQAVKALEAERRKWVCDQVCKLKRPTQDGLDTGPVLFTPAEVDRIMSEKVSSRRYLIAMREDGNEPGKSYKG